MHQADQYDSPVQAYLSVASLDERPIYYHALSYCWGTAPATRLINIGAAQIAITETLESALRRLRSVHQYCIVWVDALCINQFDDDEKASQVGLIRMIYERATRVFVYLGEYSAESLSKPPFSNGREQKVLEDLESNEPLIFGSSEEHLTFVHDILNCPWFHRTWVIQESTVNQNVKVIYGSLLFHLDTLLNIVGVGIWEKSVTALLSLVTDRAHPSSHTLLLIHKLRMDWLSREVSSITLSKLEQAVKDFENMYEHLGKPQDEGYLSRLRNLQDEWQFMEEGVSTIEARATKMIDLLKNFRQLSATDPRDKIYATLGLATDALDVPEVNYKLSADEVFRSFAACLVRKGDFSFVDLESLMMQAVDPARLKPESDSSISEVEGYFLFENRRLCITRAGRLGLVPETAREGDEILIIPGAITPFIIRMDENDDSRRLVGDCFIRGLMHGEGLRKGDIREIVIS
ncbi:MAG: hypothetical protein Q9225_003733 [Loekoesia sp. 1 TL-2023]